MSNTCSAIFRTSMLGSSRINRTKDFLCLPTSPEGPSAADMVENPRTASIAERRTNSSSWSKYGRKAPE
eukprot:CAMPEP_0181487444 /NCGR_PEP_ID=MMETSP1110-20121109/47816_1 /TAXON_ID=174948 /ORGANISM="Symbiodinium sp., Strain CCMP421" /LENGTH=68 /DNA_ID=CAMNT_0023613939 /DNA_START=90 /DNA_END=296 /DNA_ORIENTATION=+